MYIVNFDLPIFYTLLTGSSAKYEFFKVLSIYVHYIMNIYLGATSHKATY